MILKIFLNHIIKKFISIHSHKQRLPALKFPAVFLVTLLSSFSVLQAQTTPYSDSTNTAFTLEQCVEYALQHQPALHQSLINESVTRVTNAINQSTWYPQVGATAGLTHYIQLPTSYNNSTGTPVRIQTGIANVVIPGISATQTIFNPQLIYYTRVAPVYVKQAKQITDSTKINIVSTVNKSFYSLLLTLQQINIFKEDTVRLAQNVRDSYHQYVGGIVDETDYEEATITLNNSVAQLKQETENVVPQYAALKQLMGYEPKKQFNVVFDSTQMMSDIDIDTTEQLQYEHRIEYQELATAKDLQHELTRYYHLAALPTLSASYTYNYEFENSDFSKVFSQSFPYSYAGLSVSVPIFSGFYRLNNLRRSKLEENNLDWSVVSLKSEIYTEYTTALAGYKSNLYNLNILQANTALAKRVYFVVTLQYKEGIVPYLNVITAESNLISSEIGYLNALFQVLSSKIDLEKAMGDIRY